MIMILYLLVVSFFLGVVVVIVFCEGVVGLEIDWLFLVVIVVLVEGDDVFIFLFFFLI